jgi:hypothetical protein
MSTAYDEVTVECLFVPLPMARIMYSYDTKYNGLPPTSRTAVTPVGVV